MTEDARKLREKREAAENFWLKKRQVSQQSPLIPKKQRVLNIVEESRVPLSPRQVFDKISAVVDIKHSTVRNYLRDLVGENKVLQPYPGYYCNRVTYGVMCGELRVHNFRFHVAAPFLGGLGKFADFRETTGDVELFVQFGVERRQVSGRIECDFPGVVKDTLLFALHRVLDVVELVTGRSIEEGFVITKFDNNKDYPGRCLEGKISCLTRQQLFNVIERFYQKDDAVRLEHVINRDMTVEEVVALLKHDLPDGNTAEGLFVLKERVEALTTCHKQVNRNIGDLRESTETQIAGLRQELQFLVDALKNPVREDVPVKRLEDDYSR